MFEVCVFLYLFCQDIILAGGQINVKLSRQQRTTLMLNSYGYYELPLV